MAYSIEAPLNKTKTKTQQKKPTKAQPIRVTVMVIAPGHAVSQLNLNNIDKLMTKAQNYNVIKKESA
jgi:hypothetical protein